MEKAACSWLYRLVGRNASTLKQLDCRTVPPLAMVALAMCPNLTTFVATLSDEDKLDKSIFELELAERVPSAQVFARSKTRLEELTIDCDSMSLVPNMESNDVATSLRTILSARRIGSSSLHDSGALVAAYPGLKQLSLTTAPFACIDLLKAANFPHLRSLEFESRTLGANEADDGQLARFTAELAKLPLESLHLRLERCIADHAVELVLPTATTVKIQATGLLRFNAPCVTDLQFHRFPAPEQLDDNPEPLDISQILLGMPLLEKLELFAEYDDGAVPLVEQELCAAVRTGFCLKQIRELLLVSAVVSTGFLRCLAAAKKLEKVHLNVARANPADLVFFLHELIELRELELLLAHEAVPPHAYEYKTDSSAPEAEVKQPFTRAKLQRFSLQVDDEEDTQQLAAAFSLLRLPSVDFQLQLRDFGRPGLALIGVNPNIEVLRLLGGHTTDDFADYLASAELSLPHLRSVEISAHNIRIEGNSNFRSVIQNGTA